MGKLDYYPLDCQREDEAMDFLEAQFGVKGFAVVVKLYLKTMQTTGYYYNWNDDTRLLFSHKIGLNANLVSDIVLTALKRGIFDKRIFETYGVLTSAEQQEKFFNAVSRRQEIFLVEEYLLVDYTKILKDVNIIIKNVDGKQKNVDISTQSKVKETKVKKTKEDKAPRSARADVFAEFAGDNSSLLSALKDFEEYRAKSKSKMTDRAKTLLIGELKKFGSTSDEWIAIINQSILRSWKSVFPLKQDNQLTQQSNYYSGGERIGEHII